MMRQEDFIYKLKELISEYENDVRDFENMINQNNLPIALELKQFLENIEIERKKFGNILQQHIETVCRETRYGYSVSPSGSPEFWFNGRQCLDDDVIYTLYLMLCDIKEDTNNFLIKYTTSYAEK